MREALSAITIRGRSFIAAGATIMVFAILAGDTTLLRVGALLVLLPLLAAYFLGRSRFQLQLTRTVTPRQVSTGQPVRVHIDLTNTGRAPTGLLLLEDRIPYPLGSPPRFVVDRMGPRWRRRVAYTIASEVRGKFTIGPMTARLSDPFGLVQLDRAFSSTSSVVVTPPVVALPAVPLRGAWTGSGENRPRAFASGSAEDISVREYRRGDDLRRVHWRSSAHAGELMVRREEQSWKSRATLVLDNRTGSHRGSGASSSFERAVSAAASIAVHLIQRGFAVRLVTATGAACGGSWHTHTAANADTSPLLESLAVLDETPQRQFDLRWVAGSGHSGLLIAILGTVGEHDLPALSRMRHSASTSMALALNGETAVRNNSERRTIHDTESPGVALLRSRGWRAADVGPADPLPLVWQQLNRAGRRLPAAARRPS